MLSLETGVVFRMNSRRKRCLWSAVFFVALAYIESSVVVYLRALYYPQGFGFPLEEMSLFIYLTEAGRLADRGRIIRLAPADRLLLVAAAIAIVASFF